MNAFLGALLYNECDSFPNMNNFTFGIPKWNVVVLQLSMLCTPCEQGNLGSQTMDITVPTLNKNSPSCILSMSKPCRWITLHPLNYLPLHTNCLLSLSTPLINTTIASPIPLLPLHLFETNEHICQR